MIASSSSSPPTRIDCETTMPPSEMTATADGRGHGLLDQVGLARAGRQAGLLDGALLHAGHARGHADDDPRVGPAILVHLLDEVAEHLLRHLEVGDDAVLERPDGGDRARRAAEHPLGLDAHGVDLARALVHRHDGRLGEHDAAAAHVHEGVRGAEIDRHVAAAESGEVREEAHEEGRRRTTDVPTGAWGTPVRAAV
jgi:hypothetical protein